MAHSVISLNQITNIYDVCMEESTSEERLRQKLEGRWATGGRLGAVVDGNGAHPLLGVWVTIWVWLLGVNQGQWAMGGGHGVIASGVGY